jgi:hypothetical protein
MLATDDPGLHPLGQPGWLLLAKLLLEPMLLIIGLLSANTALWVIGGFINLWAWPGLATMADEVGGVWTIIIAVIALVILIIIATITTMRLVAFIPDFAFSGLRVLVATPTASSREAEERVLRTPFWNHLINMLRFRR